MSDHYLSIAPGKTSITNPNTVVVSTSTTGGSKLELRLTDGTFKAIDVVNALEWMADMFRARNKLVVPTDMLTD